MLNSNILMYTTEDGLTKIEATFDNDTVWLSIDQMAELFQRDRSVIGKHVRNIFKEGELDKNLVWAKFAYTASDGKAYHGAKHLIMSRSDNSWHEVPYHSHLRLYERE